MKPEVAGRDVERIIADVLESLLAAHEPDVTVGIGVPGEPDPWTIDSPPHVEVALDGTTTAWPIYSDSLVRLVARSSSTSRSKALAQLCEGLLLSYGDSEIVWVRSATGVAPATDPKTRAELASVSVTVRSRLVAIPTGS